MENHTKETKGSEDEPTCEKCGESYSLDTGMEATAFCNNCVHAVAEDATRSLREILEWIDNWDPNFIHDPDWPAYRQRANEALRKSE